MSTEILERKLYHEIEILSVLKVLFTFTLNNLFGHEFWYLFNTSKLVRTMDVYLFYGIEHLYSKKHTRSLRLSRVCPKTVEWTP